MKFTITDEFDYRGTLTETRRYVVYNGVRLREDVFNAFLPTFRECAKAEGKPLFALTEIVKENEAGRSYLVTRRGSKPKRRLIELGIRNDGQPEEIAIPKEYILKTELEKHPEWCISTRNNRVPLDARRGPIA